MLTQFTKPTILETIGQNRIAKFLDEFFHDLAIAKSECPLPKAKTVIISRPSPMFSPNL